MKIITHLEREIAEVSLRKCLRHQARLETDVGVAHIAFEFGLGDERCDRVEHHDVDRVRADEHLGDIEGLFAGVGLRDEQIVEVDAEVGGVGRIERVLDVDEGGSAAVLLGFGDDVQGERRFTARFRPVDLDDTAAGEAADAEREIEGDRPGRDDVERHPLLNLAHLHDGAFAELTLDLSEGIGKGGSFFVGHDSLSVRQSVVCVPTVSRLSANCLAL